jgi:hypothetical protein
MAVKMEMVDGNDCLSWLICAYTGVVQPGCIII